MRTWVGVSRSAGSYSLSFYVAASFLLGAGLVGVAGDLVRRRRNDAD